MKINVVAPSAVNGTVGVLVLPVTSEQFEASAPFAETHGCGYKRDFTGKAKTTHVLYDAKHGEASVERVVLLGLGKSESITVQSLRMAVHAAIAKVRDLKTADVVFVAPTGLSLTAEEVLEAVAGTAILSDWNFDKYVTEEDAKPFHVANLTIVSALETAAAEAALAAAVKLADSVVYARNVCNERGDVANPDFFEAQARELAATYNLGLKVLQFEDLKREGLNCLAAVGQAAVSAPRLIMMEYNGAPEKAERIAVVGKGITFDTGGLNLKGTGFIESMYMDKGGASAVLGITRAVASLGLKVNIVGVIAAAENAIDAASFKPSAILKSYKGLTVEIGNTDAEGRLALCDAMSYVQKNYENVTTLLDLATLTGAIVIALGEHAAGLFCNDDEMSAALNAAGNKTFERVWRMPLYEEYKEETKGKYSDLRNLGKNRQGGACTAAAYLSFFVEQGVKWAHIDIAGSGMYSEPRGYVPKDGNGFGVQLVTEYIKGKQ